MKELRYVGMAFAYAAAWISTGAAVCYALYLTHSAYCLWAMLIPTIISMRVKSDDEEPKT